MLENAVCFCTCHLLRLWNHAHGTSREMEIVVDTLRVLVVFGFELVHLDKCHRRSRFVAEVIARDSCLFAVVVYALWRHPVGTIGRDLFRIGLQVGCLVVWANWMLVLRLHHADALCE